MLLYMSADELANKSVINGECGEVVNTAGCGPVMRGFDPHRSPQITDKAHFKGFFYVNFAHTKKRTQKILI